MLLRLDTAALMGYTGAVFERFFGSLLGIGLSAACTDPLVGGSLGCGPPPLLPQGLLRAGPMLVRAGTIWLVILVLASLNGAVRDLVVAPRIGDTAARAISTLILCGLVLLVTWLSIRWVGPRSGRQALAIGLFWLVLTLAFEVGAGRLSGKAWSVVLADYDVLRGRIWVLVLIVTCLAPVWAGRVRGLAA